jgi:plastocyanin
MVSPGGFTEIVTLSIGHALAPNDEPVTLTGTSPTGISVSFSPSSPVQLPASKTLNVTIILTASQSTALGNDTIQIHGVSGTYSQTASFTLRVVQYRVIMLKGTFLPAVMNVTTGSTVYWQNLDGPAIGCNGEQIGTGAHSVVFTTIPGANSSTVNQFGIYSYKFTTPGSYFYYSSLDTDHVMNGTINVTGAGAAGEGMVSRIPAFSYFKGSSATTASATGTEPPSAVSKSPVAVGGLAITGLVALNLLLGLAALGLASAMIALGKGRLASFKMMSGFQPKSVLVRRSTAAFQLPEP